ncbi:MAG: hypothetical protein AAFP76_03335 [Bacteroidota bacterium]
MTKPFILLFALLSNIATFNAQNDCSVFYPFTEGSTAQITTYGKKEKVASIVDYQVTHVAADSGNTIATIKSLISDKNNELISESSYDITCTNEGIEIDFKSLFNPQLVEQFNGMETEISGTNVVLPNDLTVGQQLPDADLQVKVNMGGINMNMDFIMSDRKVVGEESVTTPAGTFECFVITYSTSFKMGMNRKGAAKQWISKGVGLVKQEDYNKKGKVTSSSLLTSFSK